MDPASDNHTFIMPLSQSPNGHYLHFREMNKRAIPDSKDGKNKTLLGPA